MKTVKTLVAQRKTGSFTLTIDDNQQNVMVFDTKTELRKYSKINHKIAFNRLDGKSRSLYENFTTYLIVVDGEFENTIACVNDLDSIISFYDKASTSPKTLWVNKRGGAGNVKPVGYDFGNKVEWTVNKDYDTQTKKIVKSETTINKFKQAQSAMGSSWALQFDAFVRGMNFTDYENAMTIMNEYMFKMSDADIIDEIQVSLESRKHELNIDTEIDEESYSSWKSDLNEIADELDITESIDAELKEEKQTKMVFNPVVKPEPEVEEVEPTYSDLKAIEKEEEMNLVAHIKAVDIKDPMQPVADHFGLPLSVMKEKIKEIKIQCEENDLYREACKEVRMRDYNSFIDWKDAIQVLANAKAVYRYGSAVNMDIDVFETFKHQ